MYFKGELKNKMDRLDRIIELLTEISQRLEKPAPKPRAKRIDEPDPNAGPRPLIQTYCDAYKRRYGSYPIIDGKTAGLAKGLLKAVSLERATELVQAYLQMEDAWFKTKCHDFPTFIQNVSKVAVALHNGTGDPHEKAYWAKVFGGDDDQGRVYGTDKQIGGNVGGTLLPARARNHVLEGVQKRKG